MIITPQPPLVLPEPDEHLPKGLHVSHIIKDMLKALDPTRYDKHDAQGKPVPMDMQKVTRGQNFEQALEKFLLKAHFPTLFRPDPIKVDGIWMSPDGVTSGEHWGLDEWVVTEYKLTWYSERKDCPGDKVFQPWLWQIKAYCYGLGTHHGLLVPQFINGNYAPPRPTAPVPRLLTWTDLEIKENWEMLRNHAKFRGWL